MANFNLKPFFRIVEVRKDDSYISHQNSGKHFVINHNYYYWSSSTILPNYIVVQVADTLIGNIFIRKKFKS